VSIVNCCWQSDQNATLAMNSGMNPTVIMIRWPDAPTITAPATFNATAAEAMKILPYASTRYAQIRAQRRC